MICGSKKKKKFLGVSENVCTLSAPQMIPPRIKPQMIRSPLSGKKLLSQVFICITSMQSQQTKIHRATRYGVSTWCHFHVTTGSVMMVVVEALAVVSDPVLLLDELLLLLLLLLNRSAQHEELNINSMTTKKLSLGKSAILDRFHFFSPAFFFHLLVLSDLGSLFSCKR